MASTSTDIDDIIRTALTEVIRRVAPAIASQVAAYAAEELERQLAVKSTKPARAAVRRPRRAPRGEMTKWVADRSARRVPTFVIELTGGLDTKKKIVAKFGEDAAFEKGRPTPPAKTAPQKGARTSAAATSSARIVAAKSPVWRKVSA
jgi:hypothetical protein